MTGIWAEGYETHQHIQQLQRKYATASGTPVLQAGRVFGSAFGPSSLILVTPSLGVDNVMTVGFGFRLTIHTSTLNSGNQGLYFELGLDEQAHVEFESTSGTGVRFHIRRGGTTVATSSYFDFGVWHYIEIQLTLRTGTDGAYELRRNGVRDISGSGVNLAASGSNGADIHAWRFNANVGTTLHLDDIYVVNSAGSVNNNFLGPSVVEGTLPNANGATIQWTQNGSGDNFTSVDDPASGAPDEAGVGGTVGSDTDGQIDLYAFEDLANIRGDIHFVQLGIQMGMAAVGTRTVRTKYRDPDTTVVNGASHVVDSTVFDEFPQVFDQNPNSAAPWDVDDINNGQFGQEVVS